MSTESLKMEELKALCAGVKDVAEGGTTYILLPQLALPVGCEPGRSDALLRPLPADGYNSRLFFADKIKPASGAGLNWNSSGVVILQRSWHAYSWRIPAGLTPIQMLAMHLKALR